MIKKLLLLIIIAAAGTGGWFYITSQNSDAPSYRTEKVTRGNISALVSASGTINPVELVTVGSQVSGKIEKLHAKVNDHVTVGQLLAEIDPALLLAQIKQDKSALENAKIAFEQSQRDFNRAKMLFEKDFVARVDMERANQSFHQAKNSYDAAITVVERDKTNLNYANITSPIDGVIIYQAVTQGQTLQTSQAVPDLFRIAGDLKKMKIDVNFSESDITKIKVGMPVAFTVNAFPERTFNGTVNTVNLNPSSQSGSGVTYSVLMDVRNDDNALLPGMTAYVSVILSEQKDVLRLPLSALRFNPPKKKATGIASMFGAPPVKKASSTPKDTDTNKTVYVLRDNVLTPVQVVVGASDEAYIEITGDALKEGDEVVVGIQKNTRK